MEIRTTTAKGNDVKLFSDKGDVCAVFVVDGVEYFATLDNWIEGKGVSASVSPRFAGNSRIVLSVPKEDWEKVRDDANKFRSDFARKIEDSPIVRFVYEAGCDAASKYEFVFQIEEREPEILKKRWAWNLKYKRLEKEQNRLHRACIDLMEFGKKVGAEPIPSSYTTYGGWNFEGEALAKLLDEILVAEHRREIARLEEERKEREAFEKALAEAKEKGEPVVLKQWVTSRCMNGNDGECSFDSAVVRVFPDGTVKTTYTCCF